MNEEENLQLNQDEMIDDEMQDEEESEGGGEIKPGPKISLFELLIFPLPFAIIADLVDFISWSGVGTLISWVLDIVTAGGLGLWLFLKGARGEYMVVTGLIEMIPFVDFLPLKTTVLIWLYVKQKNPALGKITETMGKASAKKSS